jgi:F1F0 ATPase subunit 2
MTISDGFRFLLSWAGGVSLGLIFFGGLWWTVRKGMASARPALWFLGSMVVRTSIVIVGIYLMTGGRWESVVPCLIGFVMARLSVTRFTRQSLAISEHQGGETTSAS